MKEYKDNVIPSTIEEQNNGVELCKVGECIISVSWKMQRYDCVNESVNVPSIN